MFQENQIFTEAYPPEAAEWCNESETYYIAEIESTEEGIRQFQIKAIEPYEFTAEEQISILQAKLTATDYVIVKIAEGAATREEYEDVIEQREQWRAQINALQEQL